MAKQDTVISSDSTVTAVVPGETAKVDSTVKAVLSAADSLPQPCLLYTSDAADE